MPNKKYIRNSDQYDGRNLLIVPSSIKTTCLLYDKLPYTTDAVEVFINRLQPFLTPDLRSADFNYHWGSHPRHPRLTHPMCGACVPATQAIFYAFDTDDLVPHRALDDVGMMHWWCKDKNTGEVIDAAAPQYTDNGVLPPYEGGSSARWYGWKGNAQIRSLRLLNRVLCDSQFYECDGDDYTPPGVLPV